MAIPKKLEDLASRVVPNLKGVLELDRDAGFLHNEAEVRDRIALFRQYWFDVTRTQDDAWDLVETYCLVSKKSYEDLDENLNPFVLIPDKCARADRAFMEDLITEEDLFGFCGVNSRECDGNELVYS